ncbi:sperm-associated antigen 7 homolog isoform X2 [Phymastichus coffea]|uniref:sperm-associated antigen 7 homolog isoform X2 n=1 Tax=Phymastichus coffea TaxID=108790 RepID=UPI00273C7626|nr:sperm-associated antigen 7 homolog isoform X2 [Phymastichus coffea]XP_058789752.1 sperm-associated antigen 7 homolog isoform X2 [Phymastichus coffea]
MDFLNSILDSMEKPPAKSDKERALMKKQQEVMKKNQVLEANNLKIFREQIEEQVNNFLKDDFLGQYSFPPMNQICRSIIHDVCEIANILAYSFGDEEIDRHIVIFKKEHAPSEEHLNALRKGEEWNEGQDKQLREKEMYLKKESEKIDSNKINENFVPNTNYQDKYEHLIGKRSALVAARKTKTNCNYGCVSSENKRDQRSIEQTLADIRKKRRKI